MKIKLRYIRHTESTVFSNGVFYILPAVFFKYFNFGKVKSIHVGIVFMYNELSFQIRNDLKLTKQDQTKAG
jgi:hypothetical protein